MKTHVRKQTKMAMKKGMSPLEVCQMRELARKECEIMEKKIAEENEKKLNEGIEKTFLYMLAIPLSILFNDYWQKSAKKRAPRFIEEVIKYYLAVQDGQVSEKELVDTLYDLAGVTVDAEWLERVKNGQAIT